MDMEQSSGYYYPDSFDQVDLEHPFSVYSCGRYKLVGDEISHTCRPSGRQDYQLLYVADGVAYFQLPDGEHKATQGDAVLYHPRQSQDYIYMAPDHPEVFWLHFSGTQVETLLRDWKLDQGYHFHVSCQSDYQTLFHRIIRELQLCEPNYVEMASLLAQELLSLMSRNLLQDSSCNSSRNLQIRQAIAAIHEDYRSPMSIAQYAQNLNMSICWFIRIFKQYTGLSPQQYIIRTRMIKARELLSASSYNVSEIAAMVGYDNPLYFSRLFKKTAGISPREYRQLQNS